MTTDYKETEVDGSDLENRVLETLAEGHPFVFIVANVDTEGHIDLRVATGGGIPDTETIKNLLHKTLAALP
jgi:hypothetical protein